MSFAEFFWIVVFTVLGFRYWSRRQEARLQREREEVAAEEALLQREREEVAAEEALLQREREAAAAEEARLQRHREAAAAKAALRDANVQPEPYDYEIGDHASRALAIRYGIANQDQHIKEYWYYGKGGVKKRDPDRDRPYWAPSKKISIRKIKHLGGDQFLAYLPRYGDRQVKAVIERGREYVKTFLPLHDDWFEVHKQLEETLKNNPSFSLRELARIHVDKVIR